MNIEQEGHVLKLIEEQGQMIEENDQIQNQNQCQHFFTFKKEGLKFEKG